MKTLTMLKISILLSVVGLALCGPSLVRTRREIETLKDFLEKSRTDDGVLLSERMLANPKARVWENSGKFEGDILLYDWQVDALVKEFATGRNAYIWPNSKWPDNTIVYEFGNGEFDDEQKEVILKAIQEIEENTCLKFRKRRSRERDYVRITGGPEGCYAGVGYGFGRGSHLLNVARSTPGHGCLHNTVIIHEFLHVIGFFHMQSTHNRDDYIRILWENIERGMERNFERYGTDIVDNLGLPYDYTSCMHYGPYSFSSNGKPTIVATRKFEGVMGDMERVSDLDWLRVRRHYNCSGAWSENTASDGKINVAEDSPEVLEDSPEVLEDSPEVLEESPEILEDSPEVLEDSPEVVEDV